MLDGPGAADARELVEWGQLFAIHHEEQELRQRGYTEDEIADVIAGDAEADAIGSGLERLMTEEQLAARLRDQALAESDDDDEDD